MMISNREFLSAWIVLSLGGVFVAGCKDTEQGAQIGPGPISVQQTPAPTPAPVGLRTLSMGDLQNKEFKVQCQDGSASGMGSDTSTGSGVDIGSGSGPHLVKEVKCAQGMAEFKKVFFRVTQRKTKSTGNVSASLHIWGSKRAFESCGSVDYYAEDLRDYDLETGVSGNYSRPHGMGTGSGSGSHNSGVALGTGTELSEDSDCVVRAGMNADRIAEVKNHKSELSFSVALGKGFTVTSTTQSQNGHCRVSEERRIYFTPIQGLETAINGKVQSTERRYGCDGHRADYYELRNGNWNVSFTQ